MTRKLAAALFAATMLATPAFAADSAGSTDKPAAQAQTPAKAANTSDKASATTTKAAVKKHRVHARVKHHRVAKHAKPATAKAAPVKPSATTIGAGTQDKPPVKN